MSVKKPIILAVDDEIQNMSVVKEIFDEDYDLSIASSGEEALEILEELKPDVVLLDVMMPGIDGYEVCQKIRDNEKLCFTKTIMVSAKALIDEKLRGYQFGANDYVTKPFNDEELLAKVKSLVKLKYAEEVEVLKGNVLKFLSHEIRTPLNSVLGFTSLLKQSATLSEYEKLQLNLIIKAGNELLELSDRSLLAHELKKPLKLIKESVDMTSMINKSVDQFKPESIDLNLSLVFENNFINHHDYHMVVDVSLMERAIAYVMSAIVKLSPKNSTVYISAHRSQAAFQISIKNRDIEIKDQHVQELFDEIPLDDMQHYQSGQALGLSLAKSIIELHDGELLTFNDLKRGLEFVVTFSADAIAKDQ